MARTLTIQISGMSCEHCNRAVEQALRRCAGVQDVRVSLGRADVVYDESVTPRSELLQAVRDAGPYDVTGFSTDG